MLCVFYSNSVMVKNFDYFLVFLFLIVVGRVEASVGDSTPYFYNCKISCREENCSDDGVTILPQAKKYYKQTFAEKLLQWTCEDECQYNCMWKTVHAFRDRKWPVPQFYGKWPFVRILGFQEPASVFFSIMNLLASVHLLRRLRREIKRGTPCYKLWNIFYLVCINGWIWSTVFHARDFPLTELLDYASAYSIVLCTLYCLVMRLMYKTSIILRGITSAVFLSFYLNYFAYLSVGQFSYHYNMKVNIITGCLAAVGWIIWGLFARKKRTYYWKIQLFYILFGFSLCLEVLDFPPILWTFDAHSLWHLSSFPLSFILYSFIRDDCLALGKENELTLLGARKVA